MKWTVKIERIDEAGILLSTTVGYVERPELTSEAATLVSPMIMASA